MISRCFYAILPGVTGSEIRRTVYVVAAVVLDDSGRVLAVQCPPHKHQGGWEFPGGKIEPGESPQAALRREIAEELGVQIEVGELLHIVEWDYPAFHLSMQCFTCRAGQEPLQLREHAAARWLSAVELDSVPWLPADVDLLPHVAALLKSEPC